MIPGMHVKIALELPPMKDAMPGARSANLRVIDAQYKAVLVMLISG